MTCEAIGRVERQYVNMYDLVLTHKICKVLTRLLCLFTEPQAL